MIHARQSRLGSTRTAAGLVLSALLMVVGGCDEKALGPIDRTPPELLISSLADADTVSGVSFPIEVEVTDDAGVDRVEYRVGDTAAYSVNRAPYTGLVVTLPYPAGTEVALEVEAFDLAGNSVLAELAVVVAARTLTQVTTSPNADRNPAWSPTGLALAFEADRDGGHFDIWIANADGTGEARLTANVNEDRNPVWSFDGSQIIFNSDRGGNDDLWILPLATGEADAFALTTANNADREPAISRDGTSVYFTSDRGLSGVFNIWRTPTGGIGADQITAYAVDDISPALSSMGGYLAFVSPLNFSTNHIRLLSLATGAVTLLTGDTGYTETEPAWAPQERAVLFSRSSAAHSNLWFQELGESATPVQITFGTGTVGDGGAAWSPDGARIAFHSDRGGNLDIYVIE